MKQTPIGTRATSEHIVRRDTATGMYEEINARFTSKDAIRLQEALTNKRLNKPKGTGSIRNALFSIGVALLIVYYFAPKEP